CFACRDSRPPERDSSLLLLRRFGDGHSQSRATGAALLELLGCALRAGFQEHWNAQTEALTSTSRGRSDAGGDGASGTWMCRGRECGQGRLPERGAIPARGAAAPPEAALFDAREQISPLRSRWQVPAVKMTMSRKRRDVNRRSARVVHPVDL